MKYNTWIMSQNHPNAHSRNNPLYKSIWTGLEAFAAHIQLAMQQQFHPNKICRPQNVYILT